MPSTTLRASYGVSVPSPSLFRFVWKAPRPIPVFAAPMNAKSSRYNPRIVIPNNQTTASQLLASYRQFCFVIFVDDPRQRSKCWKIPLDILSSEELGVLSLWNHNPVDSWDPFSSTESGSSDDSLPELEDDDSAAEELRVNAAARTLLDIANVPIVRSRTSHSHPVEEQNPQGFFLCAKFGLFGCYTPANFDDYQTDLDHMNDSNVVRIYLIFTQRWRDLSES